MEKIIAALEDLKSINESYDLSVESIERIQSTMADAKVCVPIIGKFSSGKSALVNTLLGYSRRMLKEDILPETAIPMEVLYTDADEFVVIHHNDDTEMKLQIDEYRQYEADAGKVKYGQMYLDNDFLKKISDVKIVDMPGFESGFEIHNKAIDAYLPSSMAYIVAFPADDMIVRSSVGNILKELCLHDLPLCVVITKADKKNDDFEETFTKLKDSIKRYVGEREIYYCVTSSFDGNAEELAQFLFEIQEKSRELLSNNFKSQVLSVFSTTKAYLAATLNGRQLSESELAVKEEQLERQLTELESNYGEEREKFEQSLGNCIEEMKNDVQCALEAQESSLVTMALNQQDLKESINNTVRSTLTTSMQKRFTPLVERYLRQIQKSVSCEGICDVSISFTYNMEKISANFSASVVAAVAGLCLGLPIIGALLGGLLVIASSVICSKKIEDARRKAKEEIRSKLHGEIFPQVMNQVGKGIETELMQQMQQMNATIEKEIAAQRMTLEKAMEDVRVNLAKENEERELLIAKIQNDLERIGMIEDGIR